MRTSIYPLDSKVIPSKYALKILTECDWQFSSKDKAAIIWNSDLFFRDILRYSYKLESVDPTMRGLGDSIYKQYVGLLDEFAKVSNGQFFIACNHNDPSICSDRIFDYNDAFYTVNDLVLTKRMGRTYDHVRCIYPFLFS